MTKYTRLMKYLRTRHPEVAKEIHKQVCAKMPSFDSDKMTIPQMINSSEVIFLSQAINYGPTWHTISDKMLKAQFSVLGLSDKRIEILQ